VAALVTTGCSLVAPNYSASIENVQRIKQENISPSAVKRFSSVAGKDNPAAISLRGSSLASPYEGSYSAYLTEAVRQKLLSTLFADRAFMDALKPMAAQP
jgi:hypothetical protein